MAVQILGETVGQTPALFQFDPSLFCFEEVRGELVLTADLDIPLVRYNIHDWGKVIPYKQMISLVTELNIQNATGVEFPFLVVSGRTDIALVLYAAKIYPEASPIAIQDSRIREWLSGTFLAYSIDKNRGQLFCIDLELSDNAGVEDSHLSPTIASIIQERLIELSSEYRNSCQKLGNLVNRPRVTLYRKR